MAGAIIQGRLACDANFLYDLAADNAAAFTLLRESQKRNYVWAVPPTVITEIAWNAQHKQEKPPLAQKILQNILSWGITPYDLKNVGRDITDNFSRRLRHGLIDDDEINDGRILAETSLANIPVLITRDKHLLNIDEEKLRMLMNDCDLNFVHIQDPRNFLKAFKPRL